MPLKSYLCNCGSLRYNWMLHLKIKFLLCMLQLDFFFLFIENLINISKDSMAQTTYLLLGRQLKLSVLTKELAKIW